MKTLNRKVLIAIIVAFAVLFLWLFIRGPEDTWICDNGQWVKHGVPSAPMPEGGCDVLDNFNPFR